jgi:hypothetical protein
MNIPPGELTTALETLAQQANVELIFQPDQLKGLHTDGLVGMMTAQQAAQKLLEGTQLQVRTDPDNGAMMVGAAPVAGESSAGAKANAGAVALTPEEEVVVSARRAQLSVMRQEMVNLQDRFYSEYNRLNSNHWWHVRCHWEVVVSRFKQRVCRPRFVEQTMSPGRIPAEGQYLAVPMPINRSLLLKRWAEYEKNMQDQINKSPELRRLISEREALQKRYEAARKQAFKGKIIVLD